MKICVETEVEVFIEVYCAACGHGPLKIDGGVVDPDGIRRISAHQCPECEKKVALKATLAEFNRCHYKVAY